MENQEKMNEGLILEATRYVVAALSSKYPVFTDAERSVVFKSAASFVDNVMSMKMVAALTIKQLSR
jgi:hypothetical protein